MKSFATDLQLNHVVKPSEVLKSSGSLTVWTLVELSKHLNVDKPEMLVVALDEITPTILALAETSFCVLRNVIVKR